MKCTLLLCCLVGFSFSKGEEPLQELTTANHAFAAAFYGQLKNTEKGNLIWSPLSAQTVLALTLLGSKGKTATELSAGLNLPNEPETIKNSFKSLLPHLQKSDDYQLHSANKIYISEGYSINPSYQQIATEIFRAPLENINFGDRQLAATKINEWVEENTNGKIRELLSSSALDEETKLILVNALHFQGNWSVPFEEARPAKFYKTGKDIIEVPTMSLTEYFEYYECTRLNAKFLRLPYRGNEVYMTIVLPNEIEGLSALENNILDIFRPRNFSSERVSVQLPKFKTETSIDMKQFLENLGVRDLFQAGIADLSGISSQKGELYVSKVFQKAFINVTESGTEAAAATYAIGVPLSSITDMPNPIMLKVDRPFFFFICDEKSIIYFAGKITSPL